MLVLLFLQYLIFSCLTEQTSIEKGKIYQTGSWLTSPLQLSLGLATLCAWTRGCHGRQEADAILQPEYLDLRDFFHPCLAQVWTIDSLFLPILCMFLLFLLMYVFVNFIVLKVVADFVQGGRTWQPFVGSKNSNENFCQACINNFRVKCAFFGGNRKFV